ncbi:MAG: hypothetical protein RL497_1174 [Pseudomonadota bacterium]
MKNGSLISMVLGLCFCSIQVQAAERSNLLIESIRYYTSDQATVNARKYTIVKVNQTLSGGCSSLYVKLEDNNALSMLLMAKAQKSLVLVGYEELVRGVFDSTSCALVHIEIL